MTSASTPARPLYALGLRLAAMMTMSLMFAAVKWLSERDVHFVEILFYRQLLALPVAVLFVLTGPGIASLRTRRIGAHFSRSVVGVTSMALNFGAVIMLPLAEATTLGFTVPIFATIFATMFLGERPGVHRWLAVVMGFAGVIIIIGPGGHEGMSMVGVTVALLGAVGASMVSLVLRQLGRTEPSAAIVFYFSFFSTPPLAVAMLFYGHGHDPLIWAVLIGMGVLGGLTQLLMTAALRWGPVSLVLPMDYSTLLWSTAIGWIMWNTLPGPWTWAGAAIIAASSTYIAWRERIRQGQAVSRGVSIS